jgi:hypothetical protein
MVAFHFPPLAGSSGIQRTLRFAQQLPEFGWEAIVLTADPRAYERTSADLVPEVSDRIVVARAFALDTARHLSVRGRYPALLARPDRWITWRYAAIPAGMRLIRQHQPHAIWSTYPIATAHVIGARLARRSKLPWIADFRDPMAQPGYPEDPEVWKSFDRIEKRAVAEARFCVFTTPGAAREYSRRYPHAADRIKVIENGFDEESFAAVSAEGLSAQPLHPGQSRCCTAASCILGSAIPRTSSRQSADWRKRETFDPASSCCGSALRITTRCCDRWRSAIASSDFWSSFRRYRTGMRSSRCRTPMDYSCCRRRIATTRFRRSSTNISVHAGRSSR